jgi:hypothetical protein
MSGASFFIHTTDDALRHVALLAKGLKKVGTAGLVGGVGCGVMALLLGRVLLNSGTQSSAVPGIHEMSGITFIATFMASALIVFSILYLVASWGLLHQQSWSRYMAAGTFAAKLLLCVWLGRGSVVAMILFLMVAGWDVYGLWVLLSKETGQLFTSAQSTQVSAKPANLVT